MDGIDGTRSWFMKVIKDIWFVRPDTHTVTGRPSYYKPYDFSGNSFICYSLFWWNPDQHYMFHKEAEISFTDFFNTLRILESDEFKTFMSDPDIVPILAKNLLLI